MLRAIYRHTARLQPQGARGRLGWLRGAIGAGIGIAVAGGFGVLVDGATGTLFPILFAPLGASAVLAFVVPASPLAQPWSVTGGDVISAAIGIAMGQLLGSPILSAAAAVAIAISIMTVTRCLHPPGGACALLCALGATGTERWGFEHLIPITVNVLALVLVAWIYNNLTGHPWPPVQYPVPRQTTPFPHPGTYRRADIEDVLKDWDEVIDVDIDELDAVFRAVERKAAQRLPVSNAPPT